MPLTPGTRLGPYEIVAPLGAPDGKIDANDALLILKKAVGLVSF